MTETQPGPPYQVLCGACGSHIYNYHRPIRWPRVLKAGDFTPAAPDIPQPLPYQSCDCPRCRRRFFRSDAAGGWRLLTEHGWLPS